MRLEAGRIQPAIDPALIHPDLGQITRLLRASKTASRSGSVYSYGYRDPDGTGVGKAEPVADKPVVDAEYRVIVPPYRSLDEEEPAPPAPAPQEAEENADDWFEDDTNQSKNDERWR